MEEKGGDKYVSNYSTLSVITKINLSRNLGENITRKEGTKVDTGRV